MTEVGVVLGDLAEQLAQAAQSLLAAAGRSTVGVSRAELVADIEALQRVINAASAAQTVRIAQFAVRGEARDEHGAWVEVARGIGSVDEYASDSLAPRLGLAPGTADKRVHSAAKLAADLPVTVAALAAGRLCPFRAQVIAEELVLAGRDTCAAVEELIHPEVEGLTAGKIRAAVRKALVRVDPDSVRQQADKARKQRHVGTCASHLPGMTQWYAQLPATESAQAWAAIDALAQQRANTDPGIALEQARADAFVDLILGQATISTQLRLTVPVQAFTTTGSDDGAGGGADTASGNGPNTASGNGPNTTNGNGPNTASGTCDIGEAVAGVEIPGIGIIPISQVTALANTFDTQLTRMLIDAETGTTVETGASKYRPPKAMAEFVKARDGTCRFPGCAVKAVRCEIDHIVPWPLGPTTPTNLLCLCKHHHRVKTHTRWSVVLDSVTNTVTWTDPYGQTWVTEPADHRRTVPA